MVPSRHPLIRDLGLLALLVVVSHLPFLARPFHIDDRIYLEIARQAQETPLYPQDFRAVFEGKHGLDAASHGHPPLVSYLLAGLTRAAGGEREVVFHAAFLVFPVLLSWGVYLLAAGRCRMPAAVALLVVWNPAVFVLSQSVMTDIPFIALYTLAVALFDHGERRGSDLRGWAALSLSLAVMLNYLALSAIPLLLWAEWRGGKPLARLWPLILAPVLVCGGWVTLQSLHYGRFILAATGRFLTTEKDQQWFVFWLKLVSTLLNAGGMLLVLWLFLMQGWRLWITWLVLAGASSAGGFLLLRWDWVYCLLLGLFLATGVLALRAAMAGPVDALMKMWLLGFLAACLLVYYHGSVRYVVPIIVAATILICRNSGMWRPGRVILAVACTFAYSMLIADADFQFASTYPGFSRQIAAAAGGRPFWVTGEWGFRYYMEREGGRTMVREDQRPQAGDLLVKPALAMPYVTAYDNAEHVDLLRREFVYLSNPIRLLNFSSHAGFYSTGWGILPWSLRRGHEPVEIFNVFRVKKRFEGDASKWREDYFR